jgi:hypothetical protein
MNRVAVSVGVSNAALVAREGEATRAFRGRRARCQETDDPHDPTVY